MLSIYTWSPPALDVGDVKDRTFDYPLEKTGLWGEPVKQQHAVIANNCGGDIFGKGLNPPEGYSR